MKLPVLVVALALALAGCSSSHPSSSSGGGNGGSAPSVDSVAQQIGCAPATPAPTSEVSSLAVAQSTCQLGGATVTILAFANARNAAEWQKVAAGYGNKYVVVKGLTGVDAGNAANYAKVKSSF